MTREPAEGHREELPPYFANFGKRLVKSPKLYFLDTALAAFLMGLHTEAPVLQGPFLGPLFETAVVSGWVKAFRHRGEPPALFFWRSSAGLEVDLLIDRGGRLHPMEIQATATLTPRHAQSLRRWVDLAGARAGAPLIMADVAAPMSVAPGVRAAPWWWV